MYRRFTPIERLLDNIQTGFSAMVHYSGTNTENTDTQTTLESIAEVKHTPVAERIQTLLDVRGATYIPTEVKLDQQYASLTEYCRSEDISFDPLAETQKLYYCLNDKGLECAVLRYSATEEKKVETKIFYQADLKELCSELPPDSLDSSFATIEKSRLGMCALALSAKSGLVRLGMKQILDDQPMVNGLSSWVLYICNAMIFLISVSLILELGYTYFQETNGNDSEAILFGKRFASSLSGADFIFASSLALSGLDLVTNLASVTVVNDTYEVILQALQGLTPNTVKIVAVVTFFSLISYIVGSIGNVLEFFPWFNGLDSTSYWAGIILLSIAAILVGVPYYLAFNAPSMKASIKNGVTWWNADKKDTGIWRNLVAILESLQVYAFRDGGFVSIYLQALDKLGIKNVRAKTVGASITFGSTAINIAGTRHRYTLGHWLNLAFAHLTKEQKDQGLAKISYYDYLNRDVAVGVMGAVAISIIGIGLIAPEKTEDWLTLLLPAAAYFGLYLAASRDLMRNQNALALPGVEDAIQAIMDTKNEKSVSEIEMQSMVKNSKADNPMFSEKLLPEKSSSAKPVIPADTDPFVIPSVTKISDRLELSAKVIDAMRIKYEQDAYCLIFFIIIVAGSVAIRSENMINYTANIFKALFGITINSTVNTGGALFIAAPNMRNLFSTFITNVRDNITKKLAQIEVEKGITDGADVESQTNDRLPPAGMSKQTAWEFFSWKIYLKGTGNYTAKQLGNAATQEAKRLMQLGN